VRASRGTATIRVVRATTSEARWSERRPTVVVSNDLVHNGPGALVVVVAFTSTDDGLRRHVEITAGTRSLEHPSDARSDHVGVAPTARIRGPRGSVTPAEPHTIERALRSVLDLRGPARVDAPPLPSEAAAPDGEAASHGPASGPAGPSLFRRLAGHPPTCKI
jgi:mRNA-degrading endonuclease toxin of MazEF toxin-antitoxin module